jgi:tetratricopeptide (TPR) repeat protein
MGRYSEAHESFTRAKDLDVCPLRATSTILEEIRKVAREQSTIFIRMKDLVARYLAQVGDRTGIPGNESFLDHVHPVIRGHQMIAEAVLEKIVAAGLVPTSKRLTEEERNSLYSKVMEGLDPSFLALRDLNLAKTLKWAGKKEEAREGLLRVAKALDDHPEVHKMMGGFYLDDRNYDEAVKEYEKAVKLSGNDPMFIFSLAVALYRSGARSKAVEAYRALVDQGVQIPEAYSNLALIYLGEGRTDDAMQTLRVGIEKNPDSGPVTGAMGLALAMSGKPGEGVPWMLRALEIEPGNPYHLYNLAGMYSASGKKAEALRYLDMAVAKGYREAAKIAADPVFQPIRDDPLFRDILVRAR